jgi:hypothetical protein
VTRLIFLAGTALVAVHLADAALVDVEPGASVARHLPWLFPGTPKSERTFGRAYYRAAGDPKTLWQVDADHTAGAAAHPREYAQRVLGTFQRGRAE